MTMPEPTLREIEFYNVYKEADPVLYEVLMDTLEQMWLIRESYRGKHILEVDNNGIYYKYKNLVSQIDLVCKVRRRYYGSPDNRIEDMAFLYGVDYENLYRFIAGQHIHSVMNFDEAYAWAEGYLSMAQSYSIRTEPLKLAKVFG